MIEEREGVASDRLRIQSRPVCRYGLVNAAFPGKTPGLLQPSGHCRRPPNVIAQQSLQPGAQIVHVFGINIQGGIARHFRQ